MTVSLRDLNTARLMRAGYAGMFFFLPVATSPLAICGVFVLALWVLSGSFLKDLKMWLRPDIMKTPVTMLIVLPWVGLIYTPVPTEGLEVAFKTHHWLYCIALMSLLRSGPLDRGCGTREDAEVMIKAFLSGLALNSAISVLQVLDLVPLKRGAPIGLLGGDSAHIPFGLFLSAGMVISSFFFLRAGSWKTRTLYALLIVQFFVTMSYTEARSGYVALIVLSPLLAYHILGRKHLLGVLAGSVVITSLLVVSPVVQSRVLKIKDDLVQYERGNVNTSVGQRLRMWSIACAEIRDSPLIGKGTAAFLDSWERHKNDPSLPYYIHGNPHNSFLYMAVSFGLPGLVVFCWLLFIMLKRGWKRRSSEAGISVFAFTAAFALVSLVDTPLLSVPAGHALSLFAGLAGTLDD